MIHLKKLMMTLALLLTAATSAWAESKPIGLNVEYAVGDVITSTTDVYVYYGEQPSTSKQRAVKITSTGPLTIVEIYANSFAIEGECPVYYMPSGESTGDYAGAIPCLGESTGDATVVHVASGSGTLADPYVFAPGSAASATPVDIVWDAAAKTATIAAMPAGNVKVSVEYFPYAMLTTGGVTAATEAAANTDAELVTVADGAATGGTLMFYVAPNGDFSQADAIALIKENPTAWSDAIPTAETFDPAGGTATVWYYIKGDDDHSDTDPMPVAVTVLPEPTYKVEFAEGTNEAPNTWTVDPADAYGEEAPGVKKGTKVTLTYEGPRKVIGVKAEKKAAPKLLNFSPLGQIFYYYEGETWGEAIRNHPENAANGWSIVEFGITVMYKGRALCDNAHDDDITNDTVVNPNGGYMWGPEP